MFSSSWRTILPVVGSGSGSPVSGDSILGTYAPMPKPFSRIQLDWTRLLAPPAPANTSPASSVATATSPVGSVPRLDALSPRSDQAEALIAATTAIARNTIVSPTLKNSARSTRPCRRPATSVRATPIASSTPIAITFGSPPKR